MLSPLNDNRIAVLDLGTNTFNLLIRDLDTDCTLSNTKIAVKLGKGGLAENRIAPAAFQRGLDAIAQHAITARTWGVKRLFAFATSAIRSTTNGQAFADAALQQSGIQINIIDGLQEAHFIFNGVMASGALNGQQTALIMDIGGGSTEFILVQNGQPIWFESYPLGASRIMEHTQPNDPVTLADIQKMEAHIANPLAVLMDQLQRHKPAVLIGSSGSFDTLYDLIAAKNKRPLLAAQPTAAFDLVELDAITQELLDKTLAARLAMPGMVEMRADMMPISAVFIRWLLRIHPFKELHLSTFALKEGVFDALKKDTQTWRKSLL